MINGDVDLTENLDFYRDKKQREVPGNNLVPWKQHKPATYKYNSYHCTYNYNISWTSNDNAVIRINDDYIVTYDDSDSDYPIANYIYEPMALSFRSFGTINNSNYVELVYNDHTYIDISPDGNYVTFDNGWHKWGSADIIINTNPKKHSIFGERKPIRNMFRSAMKCCYKCGRNHIQDCKCEKENNRTYKILDLFKKSGKRKQKEEHDRYYLDRNFHLADTEALWYRDQREDNYENLRSFRKRWESERKIPWLRDLPSRIYEDYIQDLHEEQDYSKYLTDMGWIHVH